MSMRYWARLTSVPRHTLSECSAVRKATKRRGEHADLARVDEREHDEIAVEQRPPVRISVDETRPIEPRSLGSQHVHDVGAVEPLALHHERLLPEELLAGDDLHRHTQHLRLHGVIEPTVVHHGESIAGAEDEVDEVVML